jgi:hypothetical protein
MSGNNSIHRIIFGIARPVGLFDTHDHMAECKPGRILLSSRDNNLQRMGKIRLDRDNSIAFVASLPIIPQIGHEV